MGTTTVAAGPSSSTRGRLNGGKNTIMNPKATEQIRKKTQTTFRNRGIDVEASV